MKSDWENDPTPQTARRYLETYLIAEELCHYNTPREVIKVALDKLPPNLITQSKEYISTIGFGKPWMDNFLQLMRIISGIDSPKVTQEIRDHAALRMLHTMDGIFRICLAITHTDSEWKPPELEDMADIMASMSYGWAGFRPVIMEFRNHPRIHPYVKEMWMWAFTPAKGHNFCPLGLFDRYRLADKWFDPSVPRSEISARHALRKSAEGEPLSMHFLKCKQCNRILVGTFHGKITEEVKKTEEEAQKRYQEKGFTEHEQSAQAEAQDPPEEEGDSTPQTSTRGKEAKG